MNQDLDYECDDHTSISQLWILRLLKVDRIRNRWLSMKGFRDDGVARFLDMGDWVDKEDSPDFCRKTICSILDRKLVDFEARSIQPPRICSENCTILGKALGLNKGEIGLLTAMVIYNYDENPLRDLLVIAKGSKNWDFIIILSQMLKIPKETIRDWTSQYSRITNAAVGKWGTSHMGRMYSICHSELADLIINTPCTLKTLLQSMIEEAPSPTLKYRDYPELKKILTDFRTHIRRALKENLKGVNAFIFGPPGTGKSELARIIAREMRAQLYEVAFEDQDGDPISGHRRMELLKAAQSLLRGQRTMLVFDEAEDVFRSPSMFERSLASQRKAWMNHVFETNEVPTIWISNYRHLDSAFIRRFDFIIEMKVPPKDQRARAYKRIVGKSVSNRLVEQISGYDSLTAGVVAKANSVAQGICQGASRTEFEDTLLRHIQQTLKAQGVDTARIEKQASSNKIPKVYSPRYLNCGFSLETLPESLKAHSSCRICLYGPPGTGKSTLGYWLAEKMDRKIHVKKASDLLSPYLGETEQKIAQAFEESERENAILMIDEVDSFLQDRGQAVRGWEVQQVNELLTQMENFEGTFIASTNLMGGIDQAALRRFDLKLRFGYLEGAQARELFRNSCRQLGLRQPSKSALLQISELLNATPGDFANVRRQSRFRAFSTADDFLGALREECRIKADQGGRKMGFAD